MWDFECFAETTGSRAAVWALWSAPAGWPAFNPGIEWALLDGPFAAGAKVSLKPRGGPKSVLRILATEHERTFVSAATLPGARIRFEQELTDAGEGKTRITARIHVTGPLSQFFPRLFRLARNETALVGNLANLAAAPA